MPHHTEFGNANYGRSRSSRKNKPPKQCAEQDRKRAGVLLWNSAWSDAQVHRCQIDLAQEQ
jgi:hypothetical protein